MSSIGSGINYHCVITGIEVLLKKPHNWSVKKEDLVFQEANFVPPGEPGCALQVMTQTHGSWGFFLLSSRRPSEETADCRWGPHPLLVRLPHCLPPKSSSWLAGEREGARGDDGALQLCLRPPDGTAG